MLGVGIDTSSRVGYLALVEDDRLLLEATIDAELNHSAKLLLTLESALKKAGVSRSGIDCVGVGTGPGSLTGVRVSIAFAKGLVFALGKPLIGVCSLEAIAYRRAGHPGVISVIVDAKIGGFYSVAYKWNGREIAEVGRLSVLSREELSQRVAPGSLVISPDAEAHFPELSIGFPSGCTVEAAAVFPSAEYIARQAIFEVSTGKFDPTKMVEPIYLRPGVITRPRSRR